MQNSNETPRYQAPAVANAATSVEIASGLEAIRSFGDVDYDLYISEEGGYFQENFMIKEVYTQEDLIRFIKSIERLIRSSEEYGSYLSYIYAYTGIDKCSIMGNIDMSGDGMGLEMHHCPLTLFDICEVVIGHRFALAQAVTSLSIADEVMVAHSTNTIGMVPLCVTAHKLVHAGVLKVHWCQVIGNWIQFLRDYHLGVTPEHLAKVIAFTKDTKEEVLATYNKMSVDVSTILKIQNVSDFDRLNRLGEFLSLPGMTPVEGDE